MTTNNFDAVLKFAGFDEAFNRMNEAAFEKIVGPTLAIEGAAAEQVETLDLMLGRTDRTPPAKSFARIVKDAAGDYDLPPPELKRECPWIWAEMVAAYFAEAQGELLDALDSEIQTAAPAIIKALRDRDEAEIGRIFARAAYEYTENCVWRQYEIAREAIAEERAEARASAWSGDRDLEVDP
jgi:hypothetical protein